MNKFCLLSCRFHIKDKKKLVIQGYFEEEGDIGNRPVISLDYQPLEYEMVSRTFLRNPLEYMEGGKGDKRYFLFVDLPDNYQEYKELRCFQYENEKSGEAFHLSVKWIQKMQDKREFYIDEAVYKDGEFRVRGWTVCGKGGRIFLSEEKGKLESRVGKVLRHDRLDVERACPDCEREDIFGFQITGKGNGKTLWCAVEDEDCVYWHEVRFTKAGVAAKKYHARELSRKVQVYYQQFGLARTLKRVWEKVIQKESTSYGKWTWKHHPDGKELERQRKEKFAYQPTYGIVIPLYRTPKQFLDELIHSIQAQTYENWHLYLSDGSGKDSPIDEILKNYEQNDSRITVIRNEQPLRIVENTNVALERVKEDYIVFMDHDDTIPPETFYECTKTLNEKPETDIIYTDEDKLTADGKTYFQPHFKSDFNLDLLRSANYMCHLFLIRRTLAEKVGFLRSEYEGSQDYDFILRCIEQTDQVVHIPKILYHWRSHMDSTAGNPGSKDYAYVAGQKAITEHYRRLGMDVEVSRLNEGFYRSKYKLTDKPMVSIIIPNKDHVDDLKRCIDSIEEKISYPNLEYLIVENNSVEKETFRFYEELKKKHDNLSVLEYKHPFNYSAINNFAVSQAKGSYVLLLNNDTEMMNEECLEELLTYCMREETAVVGARLFYPDGTIQHAGVIVGLGGIAGHAFLGLDGKDIGYFARVRCAQEYSAVTGACMMVRKSVYEEVGGLDEAFAVAFNDVDFCMRVRKAGYKVVYNPFAMLYHYESKTRGLDDTEEKIQRFQKEINLFANRWKEFLQEGDPFYNPNLTLLKHDFSLRE